MSTNATLSKRICAKIVVTLQRDVWRLQNLFRGSSYTWYQMVVFGSYLYNGIVGGWTDQSSGTWVDVSLVENPTHTTLLYARLFTAVVVDAHPCLWLSTITFVVCQYVQVIIGYSTAYPSINLSGVGAVVCSMVKYSYWCAALTLMYIVHTLLCTQSNKSINPEINLSITPSIHQPINQLIP